MEINIQQNKLIADTTKAVREAYVRGYNEQQVVQRSVEELEMLVIPRVVKAGIEKSAEALIYEGVFSAVSPAFPELATKLTLKKGALILVASFTTGVAMELWEITEEALCMS